MMSLALNNWAPKYSDKQAWANTVDPEQMKLCSRTYSNYTNMICIENLESEECISYDSSPSEGISLFNFSPNESISLFNFSN